MRENRPSGSEGGETGEPVFPTPMCASAHHESAGCKSPSKLDLNFVTEGNCVAVRRGGEQLEVNDQSVTYVNSIRLSVVASLLANGEAQMTLWSRQSGCERSADRIARYARYSKTDQRPWAAGSGWRWNGWKIRDVKEGDLFGPKDGVHCRKPSEAPRYEEPTKQESEPPYER
jgi:hypothetical protein